MLAAALQKHPQGAVVGCWGSSKHLETTVKHNLLPIDLVLPAAIGVCIPGVWAKYGSPIPGRHPGRTKHDASSHAHHPCCESSRNLEENIKKEKHVKKGKCGNNLILSPGAGCSRALAKPCSPEEEVQPAAVQSKPAIPAGRMRGPSNARAGRGAPSPPRPQPGAIPHCGK